MATRVIADPPAAWSKPTWQGIEVIKAVPVRCRHPRWGNDPDRLPWLEGGSHLLLADGVDLVICHDCNYNSITGTEPYAKPTDGKPPRTLLQQANSVSGHRSGTHNRTVPQRPLYTDNQIMVVIKMYLKWRAINKSTRLRNWTAQAAEELNKLGIKPYRSGVWNAGMVSSLALANLSKPKFKNLKAGPISEEEIRTLLAEEPVIPSEEELTEETEKSQPYRHTPVDFDQIIKDAEEAKAARLSGPGDVDAEEEEPVAALPDPKFDYTSTGLPSVRTLAVGVIPQQSAVTTRTVAKPQAGLAARAARAAELVELATAEAAPSDFKLIVERNSGEPVFLYKGKLMIGKEVQDFLI